MAYRRILNNLNIIRLIKLVMLVLAIVLIAAGFLHVVSQQNNSEQRLLHRLFRLPYLWTLVWMEMSTRICLKVCALRFCFKVCALWKSLLPRNKPTKLGQLQPAYGHSDHPLYKTKVKTEFNMVFYKKWKKVQATLTQSSNQPSNTVSATAFRKLPNNSSLKSMSQREKSFSAMMNVLLHNVFVNTVRVANDGFLRV